MRIWLICAYGPIPGEGWRDYRYTMIGETLAAQGHDVVWWTSSFSHHFKRFRSPGWEDRAAKPGFTIRLVPGSGYKRNISVARFWNELTFAGRMWLRARRERLPDLIIAADPPPTIGRMALWLARRAQCPLLYDIMDLWPELFALALPERLRKWAPRIFSPFYALRKGNHVQADGLFALCESYRAMMVAHTPHGEALPSAAVFNGIDVAAFRKAMSNPSDRVELPARNTNTVRAVYAGSLGQNYDILTMLEAAWLLEQRGVPLQLVIAGVGPLLDQLQHFIAARAMQSAVYLGRLSPEQLPSLYAQCELGISAYGPVSTVAMPDKAYDYMAAGLPIVNSLTGELAALIEERGLGLTYAAGDAASLAAALEQLALDETLRAQMAKRSWEAGSVFDRDVQYGALPALIEDACQFHAAAHAVQRASAMGLTSRP